uniref:Transposase, Ptta/En/Spm, plant n=1 Tax=Nicotiana tabacum TaxID=4097 RepID=A0A1S4D316_TOBAC|nr:PREDICTED: uncharacterized protein LOC107825383 [Nicotiana tabacum]XP_016507721.1 PREDICTED: uncharacterized protein LOC107825383 [Nicotiana tabacum]XP_016507722.1 PREDICTED: uncharacterized protein LOC107825383 [Nicotiana tabacum]XP_016507723.1 PREDICTED: uncharacterized protein LOC107825383 [Nicotiana tabacum]XP_016507724.1 PREDICTED: uncharacterized protein LOC107825383 [Nicotiana tabacum]
MPKPFVNRAFNDFVMSRFSFTSDPQKVKGWINNSLNKKWKEFRLKLYHEAEDPLLSKEDIIKNVPEGIPMDQWALFVNYRFKEETKALCLRNQRIRGQQTLPHTSGAMSLARRRALMKKQGKEVDRGKVWTETHKRKDGSYVNDQAREIGERIEEIRRQKPETRAEISPNDALGVVFGPEHPGRVRGLGMGAVPTVVFKQTSRQDGCSYMGAASTSAPPPQWVQEMANMRSQLNVLTSLFQMKIGNIPEEFAHLFPTPSQAPNLGDGVPSPTGPRRSFDGSNYENGASNN